MPFAGGRISPAHFVPGGAGAIEVLVDNSGVLGFAAIGGNIFPINPNALRGHFRVGVQDGAGQRVDFDQNWAGEPPIDPPDYVFNVINQVGDPCDFGSNAYTGAFNNGCKTLNNGARWETAAGVPRFVQLAFTVVYGNAPGPDTCPRVSIFASIDYVIAVTFTG